MVAVAAGHSPWFVSEVPESSIPRARIKFAGRQHNIDCLTLFSNLGGEIELY
ncbi:Uncharacterized protein APZ42_027579 [Daphnia magna]|uniref:Uncharacterized protein n=1 Tax=Daphnia magna TaxID=35525 RepID=A0A164R8K8_9CRUS|nr:Uncharacterized protein APZ42_027579 [Daphnia magna]